MSISAFGYWHRKLERNAEKQLVKIHGLAPLPVLGDTMLSVRAGGVEVALSGCESEAVLIRVFRALQAIS